MAEAKERYVVDEKGSRVAVLLDMERYQKLLEALEELESIHAYDEAKASGDEVIPFEQAVREQENRIQNTGDRRKGCERFYSDFCILFSFLIPHPSSLIPWL